MSKVIYKKRMIGYHQINIDKTTGKYAPSKCFLEEESIPYCGHCSKRIYGYVYNYCASCGCKLECGDEQCTT